MYGIDSHNSTGSSHSSTSSSSSSRSEMTEQSSEGKEEEEKEEEKEEECGSEYVNGVNSTAYLSTNGMVTTIDGKTIPVRSDVQWPLSEGMINNQTVTQMKWRRN